MLTENNLIVNTVSVIPSELDVIMSEVAFALRKEYEYVVYHGKVNEDEYLFQGKVKGGKTKIWVDTENTSDLSKHSLTLLLINSFRAKAPSKNQVGTTEIVSLPYKIVQNESGLFCVKKLRVNGKYTNLASEAVWSNIHQAEERLLLQVKYDKQETFYDKDGNKVER